MVYFFLDYKKMSGWIFTITGWLFSHTDLIQVFLHNRSPLIDLNLELFFMFKSDRDINDDFETLIYLFLCYFDKP